MALLEYTLTATWPDGPKTNPVDWGNTGSGVDERRGQAGHAHGVVAAPPGRSGRAWRSARRSWLRRRRQGDHLDPVSARLPGAGFAGRPRLILLNAAWPPFDGSADSASAIWRPGDFPACSLYGPDKLAHRSGAGTSPGRLFFLGGRPVQPDHVAKVTDNSPCLLNGEADRYRLLLVGRHAIYLIARKGLRRAARAGRPEPRAAFGGGRRLLGIISEIWSAPSAPIQQAARLCLRRARTDYRAHHPQSA